MFLDDFLEGEERGERERESRQNVNLLLKTRVSTV